MGKVYNILILIISIVLIIGCKSKESFFQKQNTAYLVDLNQSSRVFPHRVNTIGKLQDIWEVGFRSFETDTYFENSNYRFRVGHDSNNMGGYLNDLLSSVNYEQIARIWLDFKNLNTENHNNALQYLEVLDKKFHIKQKIIIESSTTSKFFKKYRDNGWHTSYYLPTQKIYKLLKNNNVQDLENLAAQIVAQSKTQNLSAVSFDSKIYPFVKQFLEPLLDENIVYHTWWGPDLYKYNFKSKLQDNELFLNKRVKTILVRFKSKYYL